MCFLGDLLLVQCLVLNFQFLVRSGAIQIYYDLRTESGFPLIKRSSWTAITYVDFTFHILN